MVFFLNQKGVAKGGMPPCEKGRLYLCRATAVCWVDQEKVCAEEKRCFWTSVLEMYVAERHIHK